MVGGWQLLLYEEVEAFDIDAGLTLTTCTLTYVPGDWKGIRWGKF